MAGLGRGFKSNVHTPFTENDQESFKVSLVRHPYNWLVSYYVAIYPGVVGIDPIDQLRESHGKELPTYQDFLTNYLMHHRGTVGRIFGAYQADSYIRIEDTPWAVVELFESLGVPKLGRNRCKGIPIKNSSKQHHPIIGKLRQQVLLAEEEMVERFEYF